MGQELGLWGWESTLRHIDERMKKQEMNTDQGIEIIRHKISASVCQKKAKAIAIIAQWAKWHKLQKDNRKLIKHDKVTHYKKLIADAREANERGDQSAIYNIIAKLSEKKTTQRYR